MALQLKRATTARWASLDPILASGEIGIDITLWQLKIGDGTTHWSSLPYYGIGATGATGSAGIYSTVGTAILNFGSAPGANTTSTTVTGQTGISSTSPLVVFMRSDDSTADHNSMEHTFAQLNLTGGNIVAGTGFTITAITDLRLTGTFQVRWAY
jgi:Major tropism determinant N-terminal domain